MLYLYLQCPPPIFYKKRCLNRIENCGCAESAELLLSSSTFPVRIPIHSDIGGGRGVGTEQKKMIRIVPCMCHQLTDFPTRFRAGGLSSHDWQFSWLKGTVSRDFLLLVFFMNQFPPSPWVYHQGRFELFRKFAEIFAAQGWPPVSTTPAANLPPVSLTLVANKGINIRLQIP